MSPFWEGPRWTFSGRPTTLLDEREHVVERHARAPADVVGAARHAALAGGDGGGHRVLDEREVARLQPVAEHRQRRAGGRCREELAKRHVGALARAVHGEVAERGGRDAVVERVQVTQVLGGQLGHAVRRDRMRHLGLAHRNRGLVAVHRRARGVDELLNRTPDARFQQPLRGVDVVGGIHLEVAAPALADASLRCQMEDVGLVVQQSVKVGVLKAAFDEVEAWLAGVDRDVGLLHRTRVVVGEAVQARHRRAAREQLGRKVAANETGCACD